MIILTKIFNLNFLNIHMIATVKCILNKEMSVIKVSSIEKGGSGAGGAGGAPCSANDTRSPNLCEHFDSLQPYVEDLYSISLIFTGHRRFSIVLLLGTSTHYDQTEAFTLVFLNHGHFLCVF